MWSDIVSPQPPSSFDGSPRSSRAITTPYLLVTGSFIRYEVLLSEVTTRERIQAFKNKLAVPLCVVPPIF